MIVALTPNPSIDRTVRIDELRRGSVHRATAVRVDAGGKGVNVARALSAQGIDALAVQPLGGPEGALLARLLDEAGVPHADVEVPGATRINVTIADAGATTKVNEPGPEIPAEVAAALLTDTLAQPRATWIVGSGSLAPGMPHDFYAGLVTQARAAGRSVAIDTSGPSLGPAVAAGPDLIKPNHHELAELTGRSLRTLGDVRDAAAEVVAGGVGTVVVSLGADGAIAVAPGIAIHATAEPVTARSTVGAGDCLLAGLVAALDSGAMLADALLQGVAWGTAAVTLPGSDVPTPQIVSTINPRVTDPTDWDAPLQEETERTGQ